MDAEPKFSLESLDRVFREMGCTPIVGQGTWAWTRMPRTGNISVFSFAPDAGSASIRQDHVVAGALRLGLDPAEVVRRLKALGGEILDP